MNIAFSASLTLLSLRRAPTRSLISSTMPRQLRSSTKPELNTPYAKPSKLKQKPTDTDRLATTTQPPYTQTPTLAPPAPPSAPPGQTKKVPGTAPTPESHALFFPSSSAWEEWLASNIAHGHASVAGHWLRLAKKACPTPDLTYDQALPVALAHGWIDGQRKSLPGDLHYFIQRFTPRRKGSLWSKRNVGIVEGLIEEGKMTKAGMKEVQAAREDGRWERAYSGGKDIQTPQDFEELLRADRNAWKTWERLGKGERFTFLFRLETLKTVEGRERKMGHFVTMLADGRTL